MKAVWLMGLFLSVMPSVVMAQTTDQYGQDRLRHLDPELAHYTDTVLGGDVWKGQELAPRDRSLVTLAILIATHSDQMLQDELRRGLDNGLRPTEMTAMVTHLAFYSGWPNAVSALDAMRYVFDERHIYIDPLSSKTQSLLPVPASDGIREKLVNDHVSPTAPKLAILTNTVLFGEVWRRPGLAPRDRSLITIAALAANGDDDQLAFHIRRGIENGLTRAQIGESLTQLAFYRGWPKAFSAVTATEKALKETPSEVITGKRPASGGRDSN